MNVDRAGGASGASSGGPHVMGTGCVVCGLNQDENHILLCDGCDAEYHTYCLVPPLKEIPEGDFYCKSCKDANRHLKSPMPTASPSSGPTQAGFAVQDENGRMVPIRPEDVRESKYRGVLKLLHKGAKKPFVARVQKDDKYVQLGLYSSEIEAAHAYDKAAIQMFGRGAQLNFPHLHEGFVRATTSSSSTTTTLIAPADARPPVASAPMPSSVVESPALGTPGRGRGRGRGRGGGRGTRGGATAGGGGRGKRRLEDSPSRESSSIVSSDSGNGSVVKRRKQPGSGKPGDDADVPIVNGPKYLGVQVFRGYAHAQIIVNSKTVNLGTFPTAVDAAIAYDKAALKYFGGEIGSKDALHDRVVLNFPNKRAELLKQLIEESMHQKARQASGPTPHWTTLASSANRSMQSAKHNLSIKKLENWLLKLQRSVKLVEAAHRVQWDGIPLVKPEDQAQASSEESETPPEIKLELLAGAGPTIKTDFTKKQQRLRGGASQIQDAVNLMIQELKIYADDTPVDTSFHPPPRTHALLDLMSTSRFLKLCSTINELAHFNVTSEAGKSDEARSDDAFEVLVQTVVDYRTRLQMAATSEKQKLLSLIETDSVSGESPRGSPATAITDSTAGGEADAIARELLGRAKYVKRKVQRIHRVKRAVLLPQSSPAVEQEEEQKECEPSVDSANQIPAPEDDHEVVVMEVEEVKNLATDVGSTPAESVTTNPPESVESEAVEDKEVEAKTTEAKPAAVETTTESPRPEKQDETEGEAIQTSSENDPAPAAPEKELEPPIAGDLKADGEQEGEETNDEKPDTVCTEGTENKQDPETQEKEAEVKVEVEQTEDGVEASVNTSTEAVDTSADAQSDLPVETPDHPADSTNNLEGEMMDVYTEAENQPSSIEPDEENADSSKALAIAVVAPAEIAASEEEETIVEDVWEFCLALKAPSTAKSSASQSEKDDLWRLLPLKSDRGEFIQDVFLSDEEVASMEVSEDEVCCGEDESRAKAWKSNLSELHRHELLLRERVKNEMDRRMALEGVIKIEQERLSQVFVLYRRMLEGVMVKSNDAQKKHQRITRDLLLVQLMKETFAPMLEELLERCESVFLERLEKLSDRFEDFQQEFDYYTDALLSVTGPHGEQNGEQLKDESSAENGVANDDPMVAADEESSGLRGAYVSFYMEEIETLWKERCRAVESLCAILRSLVMNNAEVPLEENEEAEQSGNGLLRRRVLENLDQWKGVKWPDQLATPVFVSSFMKDGSQRTSDAVALMPSKISEDAFSQGTTAMSELKQIIIDLTQENPTSISSRSVRHSTLVVYHPVFLDHQTPKDHPECPDRLNRIIAILGSVRKKFDDTLKIDKLAQTPEQLSPSEAILLAVHSPAYLQQLKDRAVEASSASTSPRSRGTPPTNTSSALVFETNHGIVELSAAALSATRASPTGSMGGAFGAASIVPSGIAMDTYVSSKSWDVARAAAGTVCLAVDRVVRQEFRNAVCLVRPPGHHVGRHGRTLDAPSSGFCLLNNVVIGAVHARQYPWIRRVAVLDWDIHHGNGTEELMRDDPEGFFASIHLYASGKFFPGTGKSEQQQNLVNVALENSGAGSGSAVFRSAMEEQILPAMRAFRPDIIFISAGFDGHKDDILGGRAAVKNSAVPAGYHEEDYAWATKEVLKLADECCDGRVVSVLEGGYDVRKETNSLAKSVAAHVSAITSYEQERQQASKALVEAAEVKVKAVNAEANGILVSLLSKNLNDDDVVIIDDEEEDDDEPTDKSGLLPTSEVDADMEDEVDEGDDDLEDVDDDVDGDGVEVDEDDEAPHDHDDHDGDVDEDVMMTDEDHGHNDEHSADDDDADNHSTGFSFAASLSVDGEDDESRSHEDLDTEEAAMADAHGSRIDYDHMEGTGDETGDDDMVDSPRDGEDEHGDLLGDDGHDSADGGLPSLA